MVQEYAEHLPGALAQDPSQLGAWLYSCEEASHDEEAALSRAMPDLPLQVGGRSMRCYRATLLHIVPDQKAELKVCLPYQRAHCCRCWAVHLRIKGVS